MTSLSHKVFDRLPINKTKHPLSIIISFVIISLIFLFIHYHYFILLTFQNKIIISLISNDMPKKNLKNVPLSITSSSKWQRIIKSLSLIPGTHATKTFPPPMLPSLSCRCSSWVLSLWRLLPTEHSPPCLSGWWKKIPNQTLCFSTILLALWRLLPNGKKTKSNL